MYDQDYLKRHEGGHRNGKVGANTNTIGTNGPATTSILGSGEHLFPHGELLNICNREIGKQNYEKLYWVMKRKQHVEKDLQNEICYLVQTLYLDLKLGPS